jgi:hypothetical protein
MMKDRLLQIVHNIVAHPLMEILSWVGLSNIGKLIHDKTVPKSWS